ncbi:MAG: thiamine diphosphokinase [Oscillospiraceae bacterium]|nr:thiamine diphosphokinase [Oscillospiraceae bacterium]
MRLCVIVGASPEAFWDGRRSPDFVLCADGGARSALALGLKPDMGIGDCDSGLSADITLSAEKDMTDMEACLDYALEAGFESIALLGATGGRLDHFLGNLGLLERAGGRAFMLDKHHEIHLLTDSLTLAPPIPYRYVSLVPLDETVSGVSIAGAKYPLQNAVLRRAATLGVSNEPLEGKPFTVSVKTGKALLILSGKRG